MVKLKTACAVAAGRQPVTMPGAADGGICASVLDRICSPTKDAQFSGSIPLLRSTVTTRNGLRSRCVTSAASRTSAPASAAPVAEMRAHALSMRLGCIRMLSE